MGSASSIHSTPIISVTTEKTKDKHVDKCDITYEEIDIDLLYKTLFNIQPELDVREHMAENLISLVCGIINKKGSYSKIYLSVVTYLRSEIGLTIAFNEVTNLIRFIQLYSGEKTVDASCLMCPFLSEFPAWSAEIRRQELSHIEKLYSDTECKLSLRLSPNFTTRTSCSTISSSSSLSYRSYERSLSCHSLEVIDEYEF